MCDNYTMRKLFDLLINKLKVGDIDMAVSKSSEILWLFFSRIVSIPHIFNNCFIISESWK